MLTLMAMLLPTSRTMLVWSRSGNPTAVDVEGVGADGDVGKDVQAAAVAGYCALDLGRAIDESDGRAWNHGACRVDDASLDAGGAGRLRVELRLGHTEQKRCKQGDMEKYLVEGSGR